MKGWVLKRRELKAKCSTIPPPSEHPFKLRSPRTEWGAGSELVLASGISGPRTPLLSQMLSALHGGRERACVPLVHRCTSSAWNSTWHAVGVQCMFIEPENWHFQSGSSNKGSLPLHVPMQTPCFEVRPCSCLNWTGSWRRYAKIPP